MSGADKVIDVSDAPELLRLAEEVHSTHEPRILQRDGEDLALLVPVGRIGARRRRKPRTSADEEALRSAAGSWPDVDTDRLIADIYDSRRRSIRPPVAWLRPAGSVVERTAGVFKPVTPPSAEELREGGEQAIVTGTLERAGSQVPPALQPNSMKHAG